MSRRCLRQQCEAAMKAERHCAMWAALLGLGLATNAPAEAPLRYVRLVPDERAAARGVVDTLAAGVAVGVAVGGVGHGGRGVGLHGLAARAIAAGSAAIGSSSAAARLSGPSPRRSASPRMAALLQAPRTDRVLLRLFARCSAQAWATHPLRRSTRRARRHGLGPKTDGCDAPWSSRATTPGPVVVRVA